MALTPQDPQTVIESDAQHDPTRPLVRLPRPLPVLVASSADVAKIVPAGSNSTRHEWCVAKTSACVDEYERCGDNVWLDAADAYRVFSDEIKEGHERAAANERKTREAIQSSAARKQQATGHDRSGPKPLAAIPLRSKSMTQGVKAAVSPSNDTKAKKPVPGSPPPRSKPAAISPAAAPAQPSPAPTALVKLTNMSWAQRLASAAPPAAADSSNNNENTRTVAKRSGAASKPAPQPARKQTSNVLSKKTAKPGMAKKASAFDWEVSTSGDSISWSDEMDKQDVAPMVDIFKGADMFQVINHRTQEIVVGPIRKDSLIGLNRYGFSDQKPWPLRRSWDAIGQFIWTGDEELTEHFDRTIQGWRVLSVYHFKLTFHARLLRRGVGNDEFEKTALQQYNEDHGQAIICTECHKHNHGEACDHSWPCRLCKKHGRTCKYYFADLPDAVTTSCKDNIATCMFVHDRHLDFFRFIDDTSEFVSPFAKFESEGCERDISKFGSANPVSPCGSRRPRR